MNGVILHVNVETFITRKKKKERERGRKGGKKSALFDDKFTTRHTMLVDHVIEESKRRRRVKRTLSGRKYRGKIRSMTSLSASFMSSNVHVKHGLTRIRWK